MACYYLEYHYLNLNIMTMLFFLLTRHSLKAYLYRCMRINYDFLLYFFFLDSLLVIFSRVLLCNHLMWRQGFCLNHLPFPPPFLPRYLQFLPPMKIRELVLPDLMRFLENPVQMVQHLQLLAKVEVCLLML